MKQVIIIEADENDGDYINKETEITNNNIERIRPVIEAIKGFGGSHNYPSFEKRSLRAL